MSEARFPRVPEDLLKALDAAYPERSPLPEETFDELKIRCGQRGVINMLHRKFKEQNPHRDP